MESYVHSSLLGAVGERKGRIRVTHSPTQAQYTWDRGDYDADTSVTFTFAKRKPKVCMRSLSLATTQRKGIVGEHRAVMGSMENSGQQPHAET